MRVISTITGNGKDISYKIEDNKIYYIWGKVKGEWDYSIINSILINFLIENKWYLLGASMTKPPENGLGKFLQTHHNLSPRYASMIVPIMKDIALIKVRGLSPIEIKKL